jgi:RNA polymerase sigma-70 factor (ECF subfamily)
LRGPFFIDLARGAWYKRIEIEATILHNCIMLDELLIKAQNGSSEAEKEIFQHLFVRFKHIAKRRIGIEECEDLAQEACKIVLEKYKNTTFEISFERWAYGVLKNVIGNYIQKVLGKKHESTAQMEEYQKLRSENEESFHDLRRQLLICLKKIMKKGSKYARAINLIYQGYKTDDISRRLGVTPNNLYVILNRARNMMKECLEKGGVR